MTESKLSNKVDWKKITNPGQPDYYTNWDIIGSVCHERIHDS
jgi:hypothetical protein